MQKDLALRLELQNQHDQTIADKNELLQELNATVNGVKKLFVLQTNDVKIEKTLQSSRMQSPHQLGGQQEQQKKQTMTINKEEKYTVRIDDVIVDKNTNESIVLLKLLGTTLRENNERFNVTLHIPLRSFTDANPVVTFKEPRRTILELLRSLV